MKVFSKCLTVPELKPSSRIKSKTYKQGRPVIEKYVFITFNSDSNCRMHTSVTKVIFIFLFLIYLISELIMHCSYSFSSSFVVKEVKLATVIEGDPKAPFSLATTPTFKRGHYYFPWIVPLYD